MKYPNCHVQFLFLVLQMNNNIPTGLSCNWNGQRWTPTVTNLQDQWAAQTPPGIARGKVWQPKAAPPPPSSVTSVDIDDISDDHLEEVVASGFPLDLSTFRSGGSPSRHVESPLDLSLKTRKRCADSTSRHGNFTGESHGTARFAVYCTCAKYRVVEYYRVCRFRDVILE